MVIRTYRTELDQNRHNILVKESTAYCGGEMLDSPEKVTRMLDDVFRLSCLAEEHVYLIAMTAKCQPLGVFEVSHGTGSASLLGSREIFIRLLLCGASVFIIAHNHPSGDTEPSEEDIIVTRKLKKCADMMGIEFSDHIIVGNSYYSFRLSSDLL